MLAITSRTTRFFSVYQQIGRYSSNIIHEETNIGWIGTGIMGKSMCLNLIKKGGFKNVTIYSRTKERTAPIIEEASKLGIENSVQVVDTPIEVARNSEIIFSIVGYPADGNASLINNFKMLIVHFQSSKSLLARMALFPKLKTTKFTWTAPHRSQVWPVKFTTK